MILLQFFRLFFLWSQNSNQNIFNKSTSAVIYFIIEVDKTFTPFAPPTPPSPKKTEHKTAYRGSYLCHYLGNQLSQYDCSHVNHFENTAFQVLFEEDNFIIIFYEIQINSKMLTLIGFDILKWSPKKQWSHTGEIFQDMFH